MTEFKPHDSKKRSGHVNTSTWDTYELGRNWTDLTQTFGEIKFSHSQLIYDTSQNLQLIPNFNLRISQAKVVTFLVTKDLLPKSLFIISV